MDQIMKDGVNGTSLQGVDEFWRASEAGSTTGDAAASSALIPKVPLRSMSYSNLRGCGLGSTAPGKKASVVEEMETRQRENMSRKLKDLQLNAGGTPQPKDKVDMPTIVDSRPARNAALPRCAPRRDNAVTYQAVTPAALSLKGVASPGTPMFSLKGPEFPLRTCQSLTSLNRIYDRGLSVYASDDFDGYSAGKGLSGNEMVTGSGVQISSLSSSVCLEGSADTLEEETERPDNEAAENTTDCNGEIQPTSAKQKSKQKIPLNSENSQTAGPPLNLNTLTKPEIPAKPSDFELFTSNAERVKTSNIGNAERISLATEMRPGYINPVQVTVPASHDAAHQNSCKAASLSVPVEVAASTVRSHQILNDFNHSRICFGVAKEIPLTGEPRLEAPGKIDHLVKNYNKADNNRRSHYRPEGDENLQGTRAVPQPSKPSFETRLQVDVNMCDLVIPRMPDHGTSDVATRPAARLGVVSRSNLQSHATPCFVSHQKMDSFLSDYSTVDSGIGRSEAAGSPYQDSADEPDNRGYTLWTASTTDRFTGGRVPQQQQQLKRQTNDEFISTAAITLSREVTGTPTANEVNTKLTSQDTSVSTKYSYHQNSPLPAPSLRRTQQETSSPIQGTQSLSSDRSRSSNPFSAPRTEPNLGFSTSDLKVPGERETSVQISGERYLPKEVVSRSNFDVQSNQTKLFEHRKTATSNFEMDFSKSPHTSDSQLTRSLGSEVREAKRRAEGQSPRDFQENETRVGNETQWNRKKSAFPEGIEKRTETRTEVSQAYAFNKRNQDKFLYDPHLTETRTGLRQAPELKNENKFFHDPYRTGTRTDVRQTSEIKNEKQVFRNSEYMERLQLRQTSTNSSGFEPRRQPTGTKKEEQTVACGDDGMSEIEVQLIKGSIGLGFCIEGGIGSPIGDRPITVKRLFKGESAAKGRLEPGDVIQSINGQPISNKSHYQAWNQLKSLPEGQIKLVIRRRLPLPTATLV